MKVLLYCTLIMLLASCHNKDAALMPVKSQIAKDTTAAYSFSFDTIIKELKNSVEFNPESTFKFDKIIIEGQNTTTFIFTETNGNCELAYLARSLDNKLQKVIIIHKNCDADLSYYKYYRLQDYAINNNKIFITKITTEVKNKALIDKKGFLKNGLQSDASGLAITDTTYIIFSLNDINEFKLFPKINEPDAPNGFGYLKKLNTNYTFTSFKVSLYTGTLANPVFKGNPFANDPEYVTFITEGCKQKGINFGGKYTVIEKSCGAMCSHIFLVDRTNGTIITDKQPYGDGHYGYLYKKGSNLLIANSGLFTNNSLVYYDSHWDGVAPELFVWKGKKFKKI
ncbi:hypothetical protein [Flavobacterium subsaxonicum]|uniref:Lipoprotein n=1 Tax=Flavobacterium subsaxonicum WB 4.1-42 = DSM 21790 TaxID=1121898 RepID=A0A0A2MPR6_9FLAO|nr:hypothetical protein [Flavobacterium subsaxonicum]KGO94319.1 hypothetical protein Q766_05210 [Flavobacterium subsaxonicum WB 4.1-42 = DSM 21790]